MKLIVWKLITLTIDRFLINIYNLQVHINIFTHLILHILIVGQ